MHIEHYTLNPPNDNNNIQLQIKKLIANGLHFDFELFVKFYE